MWKTHPKHNQMVGKKCNLLDSLVKHYQQIRSQTVSCLSKHHSCHWNMRIRRFPLSFEWQSWKGERSQSQHQFSRWNRVEVRRKCEISFKFSQTDWKGEGDFTCAHASKKQRRSNESSTELNIAFGSGKTKTMDLQKICLCSSACLAATVWSIQPQ